MMTFFRCAIVALMLVPAPSAAQDLKAGWDAHLSGDYATALHKWRPLAEQGVSEAQLMLGHMHREGRGVPQDYAEAVRWYRKAAERGESWAQFFLGRSFTDGAGVLQNYASAHVWFNIAAAQGNEHAIAARADVASRMTAEAIAEAQHRAKTCMASNYQDCD